MREILFRGKTILDNEWVIGAGVYKSEGHTWIITDDVTKTENRGTGSDAINPETVCQFTGLTDKNGTKIFEGDILKQKTTPEFAKVNSFEWEHYGIVKFGYYDWDEGEAGYASMGWYIEPLKSVSIKPKNYLVGHIQAGLNQCDILNKYYPMEVIGNIHDNPELLRTPQNDEVSNNE